jgi:hypothetical protein
MHGCNPSLRFLWQPLCASCPQNYFLLERHRAVRDASSGGIARQTGQPGNPHASCASPLQSLPQSVLAHVAIHALATGLGLAHFGKEDVVQPHLSHPSPVTHPVVAGSEETSWKTCGSGRKEPFLIDQGEK